MLLIFSTIFQCLPKQLVHEAAQNMSENFIRVDNILSGLGITENEKSVIYEIIAAILHLGNIRFEATDTGTQVIESTEKHVTIASKLMNISPEELKEAILFRSIEVPGSTIR